MSESADSRMERAVSHLKSQLAGIRTGRANPGLLTHLQVEYYGSMMPIQQMANVSAPESNMLVVSVFDKSAVASVEKAIRISDLGLNPQTEGSVIRLRLPELTEQRRKELVKVIKSESEEAKVAIRNIRRDEIDGLKDLEKKKEITEDDSKREQDTIQKKTDRYIEKVDQITRDKEAEIMTV
jgi:ribosome recycling factor